MTEDQPVWLRILFSLVPLLMGLLILGAWFGVVPTDGGAFHAPPVVLFSLAGGLILFSILVWLPKDAPRLLTFALPVLMFLAVAIVCNWTAFAPGVTYISEVSIGPWSSSGEDPVGGRIVFGLVALAVDATLLAWIFTTIHNRRRRR